MVIVAGSASGVRAAETGWYFYGGLEAGARFYIDRPGSGFGHNADGSLMLPTQTDSRAKFEEYGKLPPGLFLDWIHLGAGPRMAIGIWATMSASLQNYNFASRKWRNTEFADQTLHLWSYSAKSLFAASTTV
jgi:hypothetical protein